MDKRVTTKDEIIRKVTGRMIILCWSILVACFIIKIFGGNFFQIIVDSGFYKHIENNIILLRCVQFVFFAFGTFLFFEIIFDGKFRIYECIAIVILFSLRWLPTWLSFIVEMIFTILIPIILNRRKWYKPIICYALMVVFQLISLFVKNINCLEFPSDNFIGIVFMIDYYIMFILAYLYNKRGGSRKMGLAFLKWLHKDEAKLKVIKDKNNAKIAQLTKENEQIDAELAKRNEEKK